MRFQLNHAFIPVPYFAATPFMLFLFVSLTVVGHSLSFSCGSEVNVMTIGVYNSFSCNITCPNYSILPALPTGVFFGNETFYGTPVETSPLITYTVNCYGNAGTFSLGGGCCVLFSFVVLGYPTEISAGFSEQNVFIGLAFIPIRFTGNTVFSEYSITPALTNGLEFDESTGRLSGVYTGSVGRRSFEVTGKNQYGSVSTMITLSFQRR